MPASAPRLTLAALNRALLARQGLLEPLDLPVVAAVEAIGALQGQYWPALPVALGVWTTLAGILASLAVAFRLLLPPAGAEQTCAGAWLGLAGAILVALAGWLAIADERPARGVSAKVGGP